MVLQIRIFFLVREYTINPHFFSGWRKVVLQSRIFFFWSTTFLEPEKKSKFEEPFFSNKISWTRLLEPLFYTFLEKWLQIKWSTECRYITEAVNHQKAKQTWACGPEGSTVCNNLLVYEWLQPLSTMALRVVKNWKYFCLKINITIENDWNLNIGVTGRCQKVPKFDFQGQFSTSKIIRIKTVS